MKYAENIGDFLKVFGPEPLSDADMEQFYYDKTMKTRTGDEHDSPLEDIYEECRGNNHGAYLLCGHRGCGKSTELNVLRKRFENDGYEVETIRCSLEIDLNAPDTSDLLILIAEKLLQIANKIGCKVDEGIISSISKFWDETTETREIIKGKETVMEAGAGVNSSLLVSLISLFAKVSTEIKIGEVTKKDIREKVKKKLSEWMGYIRYIADEIASEKTGKRPILIIEDVDKINPECVGDMFCDDSKILSEMPFFVIYTFPISFFYSPRCAALASYFTVKTLPMIKIRDADGKKYPLGMKVMRDIVLKRAEINLFNEAALDEMIKKTGGSLRDLFSVITNAGRRARRRESPKVEMEDTNRALEELKSSLTRRIERKHYQFLKDIDNGNKYAIEDGEMLLEMMQASAVLEYNGKRWHDVHPLVSDFLKEHVADVQ